MLIKQKFDISNWGGLYTMAKLQSLSINGNEVKDYIVDSGVSSGYTWIRYNSGIYVVDFTDRNTFNVTKGYGSSYYADYEFNSKNLYPFKAIYHCNANIINNGSNIFSINPSIVNVETGNIHIWAYISCPVSVSSKQLDLSFHIVGTWK